MTTEPALPEMISVDAFTGTEPVTGRVTSDYRAWALAVEQYGKPTMRPAPPDPTNWRDDNVGWGIVLPERAGLTAQQLATADDAPEPVRELVTARGGKVLRFRAGEAYADWTLRDYAGGGDLLTAASAVGMGPQQLPKYLLIYATPAEVPWHVQYGLNPVRYVGRLDLTGAELANYVTALLNDWAGSTARYSSPVVWAVQHHSGDITKLMRDTVAAPIYEAFASDTEMPSATFIDGQATPATADTLAAALKAKRPALVVTSSHGMTGPLDDAEALRANLGLLVDQSDVPIPPQRLLADWQPDGQSGLPRHVAQLAATVPLHTRVSSKPVHCWPPHSARLPAPGR